ncbi:MAG TPA: WHG domain-containing protein [Agromyces sp.]|jgi:AcrR family transcriptional regulator
MPTPRRTSLEAIVAAGCDLLEIGGLEGLTMQSVAVRVGVRAPSLYKWVRNRGDLIALIADASVRDLGARLDAAAGSDGDARERLHRLAAAARTFAHERPAAFRLVFAPGADLRLDDGALAAASASVLRVAGELAGQEHALDAARTFTAWANGFVSMELAGAFRLGGEVDRAFDFGVDRLAEAMSRQPA